MTRPLTLLALAAIFTFGGSAAPLYAKDSLGVFSGWAVFRDAEPARCYAIAKPRRASDTQPFASISNWPQINVRGQVHIRLSREPAPGARVRLSIARQGYNLLVEGRDAWSQDAQMDAAIVAALRSATTMQVAARDTAGRRFTDQYDLAGVATAMDASLVGCSGAA